MADHQKNWSFTRAAFDLPLLREEFHWKISTPETVLNNVVGREQLAYTYDTFMNSDTVLLVAMLILREYIEVWSSSFQSTMCLCDHHLHQLTRLPEADCDIRCTRCDSDTCGGIKGVSVYSCKWSTASNLSRSHWHSESYIRGNDMHNNSIHIKLITWVLRRSQRNISYFLQIIVSKDKSTSGNTVLYWLRKSYTHVEFSHPFNSFSYDEIIITISYFYTV